MIRRRSDEANVCPGRFMREVGMGGEIGGLEGRGRSGSYVTAMHVWLWSYKRGKWSWSLLRVHSGYTNLAFSVFSCIDGASNGGFYCFHLFLPPALVLLSWTFDLHLRIVGIVSNLDVDFWWAPEHIMSFHGYQSALRLVQHGIDSP